MIVCISSSALFFPVGPLLQVKMIYLFLYESISYLLALHLAGMNSTLFVLKNHDNWIL